MKTTRVKKLKQETNAEPFTPFINLSPLHGTFPVNHIPGKPVKIKRNGLVKKQE